MMKKITAGFCAAVIIGILSLGTIQAEAAGGALPEHAATIQAGTPVDGTLATEDSSEWYTFQTSWYDSYYVFQADCESENGVDIDIFPNISKQSQSFGMVTPGNGSLTYTAKLNRNQRYYIRVTNKESTANGRYKLTMTEVVDDGADAPKEARWVDIDKITGGCLETMGDRDVYKVTIGNLDVPVRAVFQNLSINDKVNFNIYRGTSLKDSRIVAKGNSVKTGGLKHYEVLLRKNTTYCIVVEGSATGNYRFGFVNLHTDLAKKKTTLQASALGKNAVLKWTAMDYAQAYEIYVATKKNGKYRLASTISSRIITTTTLRNLKKGTYYYKIRGVATVDVAGTGNTKIIRSAFSTPKKVVIR